MELSAGRLLCIGRLGGSVNTIVLHEQAPDGDENRSASDFISSETRSAITLVERLPPTCFRLAFSRDEAGDVAGSAQAPRRGWTVRRSNTRPVQDGWVICAVSGAREDALVACSTTAQQHALPSTAQIYYSGARPSEAPSEENHVQRLPARAVP
ncbi:hypothetical protein J1614_004651 [Plenodomus biglobosus]|nr:hypothetical protein J1614_004651 [Plenodomus biglobosus]